MHGNTLYPYRQRNSNLALLLFCALSIQLPLESKTWILMPQSVVVVSRRTRIRPSDEQISITKLRAGANGNGNGNRNNDQLSPSTSSFTPISLGFSSLLNRTDKKDNEVYEIDRSGFVIETEKDRRSLSPYWFERREFAATTSSEVDNVSSSEGTLYTEEEESVRLLALRTVATIAMLLTTALVLPEQCISTITNFIESAQNVLRDPGSALNEVVEITDSMGSLGILYFGVAYCVAEILAIPAIPLTASAGYLFGVTTGTTVVLLSASIAAAISFSIGRTLLRDYVEGVLEGYPKFKKLDKAIGREGFRLMLLLRLSPIFPFALSNYLYGASSINFVSFFGGTVLGFAPGTIAYVYTGYVGKALNGGATGTDDVYPWYVYVTGLSLFAGLMKVVADTATRIVEEIEAEEEVKKNFNAATASQENDAFSLFKDWGKK